MSKSLPLVVIEPRELGERAPRAESAPSVPPRSAQQLADDLALLAHPVRLQLMNVIARAAGKVCVCDLESAVPVKQPTVSHHLKILREAGLVDSEKLGVWAYYYVQRKNFDALRRRIAEGLADLDR